MTEFLNSVTARSFGKETTIRPRVASLFEPIHIGGTVLRDAPTEVPAILAVTDEVEAAYDDTRKTLNKASISTAIPYLRDISAPRETSALDDKTMQKEYAVVAAMMRSHGAGASSQAETTIASDNSSSLRSDLEDEASSQTSIHPGKNLETEIAAQERPRRPLSPQAVNSEVFQPSSSARSNLEGGAPKRSSSSALVPSTALDELLEVSNHGPLLSPKIVGELTAQMKNATAAVNTGSDAPGRKNPENASPTAEPSVHVTIGRIEVRATSETKHVGRTRTTSPVLTLEEYLRRRIQRGDL